MDIGSFLKNKNNLRRVRYGIVSTYAITMFTVLGLIIWDVMDSRVIDRPVVFFGGIVIISWGSVLLMCIAEYLDKYLFIGKSPPAIMS